MMTVRQPAVSGRFYPGRAATLEHEVDGLLSQARGAMRAPAPRPKALIVPHAGYIYSGFTAACGYVHLEPWRSSIQRVVLLGPAHYVGFSGLALSGADAFDTPLGPVRLDRDTAEALSRLPQVIESDSAHAPEHSLEVQLPFLQRVLAEFRLVPLVVGDATPPQVAAVIDACWGGPETLLLISSDLSHYLPYEAAVSLDVDTVRRILDLEGPLPDRRACGARGINGLLVAAREHQLSPTLVDRRNSGDTAGDRDRVVGYAAISFSEAGDDAT
ncbi:MAG: AmmeMemoRadiSam system protein B [Propionicimonas sp.]